MSLTKMLLELSRRHRAQLPSRDRIDFEDEPDGLRMMRVAEEGLTLGDMLPDFDLRDTVGTVRTLHEFLDRGPLVLTFFRGGWCPYCDLTMTALEEARPAIEALGAQAVGIMPDRIESIGEIARERGIAYPLLSDPANGFARTCGLAYDLSPSHIRLHLERGRDFPRLHDDTVWRLPVPSVFVATADACIIFAFADVDPAHWPDPEELVGSLGALRDGHPRPEL
ncbi:peroxiredoxin-like family protein [soil metagenome]